MVVRIGMAPRNADLSLEQAQQHWQSQHGRMALELRGIRRYVQLHAALRDGRPLLPHPGFDICAVTEYESVEAMDATFTSTAYQSDVRDDERKLLDTGRFHFMLCDRLPVTGYEQPPPALEAQSVQLWTFLRARPDVSPAALADQLRGAYADLVRGAAVLHHELLVVSQEAHAGRPAPACECVDVLWFPDEDQALDFLCGETGQAAAALLSDTAFGSERLLTHPKRMR